MRTFWKPADLMALLQAPENQLPSAMPGVDTLHTIWIEFIIDEDLVSTFNGAKHKRFRFLNPFFYL